ncbi:MAG: hypothetical protein R2789_11125 [Microthrixaceae bacterium]
MATATGYVDDISGWDFLNGDNNPLDDVDYGHGTGEARDSTAAHDGEGAAGTCPACSHLPVRVGDSFIAQGGRFAASVLFARFRSGCDPGSPRGDLQPTAGAAGDRRRLPPGCASGRVDG